jgi:error-prone DNA polymerase
VNAYVPLWCKSNYSFLTGASHPDELVEQAVRLGLPALAITDRDGVYGVVQAYSAVKEQAEQGRAVKLIIGSEITFATDPETPAHDSRPVNEVGSPDLVSHPDREAAVRPPGAVQPGLRGRLILLARNREGYARLCGLISAGRMRSPKGESLVTLTELCEHAENLICLWPGLWHAGSRGNPVQPDPADSRTPTPGDPLGTWRVPEEGISGTEGHDAPAQNPPGPRTPDSHVLRRLKDAFTGRLYIIISRHQRAGDPENERRLSELAQAHDLPQVAAGEVLYHVPERRPLHDVVTCIRNGVTLNEAGSLLPPNADHALSDPQAMAERYADRPELLEQTLKIAESCTFSLADIQYRYPTEQVPPGYSTSEWLWELTFTGARKRYGGSIPADVRRQLQKELELIDELDYCGYFLTMWEIIEYCRRQGILCQGRGSAANSAVCYCLGITAIDPVRMDLLFERFLSRERAEPPDIDLDIEHRRREEVIQHMYRKYGRERAAMVANFIRYRMKSAIRDVGKVLEFPSTALDRMAKLSSSRDSSFAEVLDAAGLGMETRRLFAELATGILDFPRHLSIHPGGFLLGSEPVHRLVPIENATMPDRTVIQWDKYDVEAMNLFKVDLLGLGALTHLDYCFRILKSYRGIDLALSTIPHDDPATFKLIRRADTVGVFQLESRAQMAMLPRLKPRTWYDIVIEVSIVRPGPITGGMVHPYLRRRSGEEEVVYPHPALEPVLRKTLGVPIFQEQVMKLAVVAADYTPGEADQLRRDMAAWRRSGRIEKHRERFISRMINKGIEPEFAEAVFNQIKGFGEYGFPESHAASFSLIAYCTAWMRAHYPAEFVCGLLNAWPMGFYSPASIVEDAKRHGTEMRQIDVMRSDWDCALEPLKGGNKVFAVRMGLRYVKGICERDYQRIVRARSVIVSGRSGLDRFIRAARLSEDMLVALARSGAFGCFGLDRRSALWEVSGTRLRSRAPQPIDSERAREPVASSGGDELLGTEDGLPAFDPLSDFELVAWDYYTSSHSVQAHPIEPHREALTEAGHPSARDVWSMPDGERTSYIGLVITRQRPETASGTMFVTLEDESGYVNLVVWKSVFERYRPVLLTAALLGVEGRIQSQDGVTHLVVDHCFKPQLSLTGFRIESRNFR